MQLVSPPRLAAKSGQPVCVNQAREVRDGPGSKRESEIVLHGRRRNRSRYRDDDRVTQNLVAYSCCKCCDMSASARSKCTVTSMQSVFGVVHRPIPVPATVCPREPPRRRIAFATPGIVEVRLRRITMPMRREVIHVRSRIMLSRAVGLIEQSVLV